MAVEECTVTTVIQANPHEIYDAWLNSEKHTEMTGVPATAEPSVGSAFTAWGGYIEGRIQRLDPGRCILQSWRTNHFPKDAEDSVLEVTLEATQDGTQVTLHHSNIPEGQAQGYQEGWQSRYFDAMARYFKHS